MKFWNEFEDVKTLLAFPGNSLTSLTRVGCTREGLMTTSLCCLSRFMDAVAWIPNPKKRYLRTRKGDVYIY